MRVSIYAFLSHISLIANTDAGNRYCTGVLHRIHCLTCTQWFQDRSKSRTSCLMSHYEVYLTEVWFTLRRPFLEQMIKILWWDICGDTVFIAKDMSNGAGFQYIMAIKVIWHVVSTTIFWMRPHLDNFLEPGQLFTFPRKKNCLSSSVSMAFKSIFKPWIIHPLWFDRASANTLGFFFQCNVYCMWPVKMFPIYAREPMPTRSACFTYAMCGDPNPCDM